MAIMLPKGRRTLSMLTVTHELNWEEFICTRYLNRYDAKSIEIVIGLGALRK